MAVIPIIAQASEVDINRENALFVIQYADANSPPYFHRIIFFKKNGFWTSNQEIFSHRCEARFPFCPEWMIQTLTIDIPKISISENDISVYWSCPSPIECGYNYSRWDLSASQRKQEITFIEYYSVANNGLSVFDDQISLFWDVTAERKNNDFQLTAVDKRQCYDDKNVVIFRTPDNLKYLTESDYLLFDGIEHSFVLVHLYTNRTEDNFHYIAILESPAHKDTTRSEWQKVWDYSFITKPWPNFLGIRAGTLSKPPQSRGTLQVQSGFKVNAYGDELSSGTHNSEYYLGLSLINQGEQLWGNITMTIDAEQVRFYPYTNYSSQTGGRVDWVFPQSFIIAPGNHQYLNVETGIYEDQLIPMSLKRTMNKTQFIKDGEQQTSVSITFEELPCKSIYGQYSIRDMKNVRATFIPNSIMTDLPLSVLHASDRSIIFYITDINFTALQLRRPYFFSFVTKVDIDENIGSSVEFKPTIMIALETGEGTGPEKLACQISIPPSLIPPHLNSASGSVNTPTQWGYSKIFMKQLILRESSSGVSAERTTSAPGLGLGIVILAIFTVILLISRKHQFR